MMKKQITKKRLKVSGILLLLSVLGIWGGMIWAENERKNSIAEVMKIYFETTDEDIKSVALQALVQVATDDLQEFYEVVETRNARFMFPDGVFEEIEDSAEAAKSLQDCVVACESSLQSELIEGKISAARFLARKKQYSPELLNVASNIELPTVLRAEAINCAGKAATGTQLQDVANELEILLKDAEEVPQVRDACCSTLMKVAPRKFTRAANQLLTKGKVDKRLLKPIAKALAKQGEVDSLIAYFGNEERNKDLDGVVARSLLENGSPKAIQKASEITAGSMSYSTSVEILKGIKEGQEGTLKSFILSQLKSPSKKQRMLALRKARNIYQEPDVEQAIFDQQEEASSEEQELFDELFGN